MASASAAAEPAQHQEHAAPVRVCEAMAAESLAHYTCCPPAEQQQQQSTGGAPDAALHAAVVALQREGVFASISEDGSCVDVLLRQREAARVSKQVARKLSLRLTSTGESPTATVLSSCIEAALHFTLVSEHGWTPVQLRGTKWLVRGQAELARALELPVHAPPPLFDCVSLRFRAARSDTCEGVLLCKAYATKAVAPKDVAGSLPRECQAALAELGSVDLTEFISDESHEPHQIEALVVATLPRLSRAVIKWVGKQLPDGDEHDEDWYRQHWLAQYGITLPETIEYWVLVQFSSQHEQGKVYPSCTLLRSFGSNSLGFGASLPPRYHAASVGAGYREIERRLFADLSKIQAPGSRRGGGTPLLTISSAAADGSGASAAAGHASISEFSAHVPKFQSLRSLVEGGRNGSAMTGPVHTVRKPFHRPQPMRMSPNSSSASASASPEEEEDDPVDGGGEHAQHSAPKRSASSSFMTASQQLYHQQQRAAGTSAASQPAAAAASNKRAAVGMRTPSPMAAPGSSTSTGNFQQQRPNGAAPMQRITQPPPRPAARARTKQTGFQAAAAAAQHQQHSAQLSAAPTGRSSSSHSFGTHSGGAASSAVRQPMSQQHQQQSQQQQQRRPADDDDDDDDFAPVAPIRRPAAAAAPAAPAPAAAGGGAGVSVAHLRSLTVGELKKLCKAAKQKVGGKKAELIGRLVNHAREAN